MLVNSSNQIAINDVYKRNALNERAVPIQNPKGALSATNEYPTVGEAQKANRSDNEGGIATEGNNKLPE
jgi:hypothetical protein